VSKIKDSFMVTLGVVFVFLCSFAKIFQVAKREKKLAKVILCYALSFIHIIAFSVIVYNVASNLHNTYLTIVATVWLVWRTYLGIRAIKRDKEIKKEDSENEEFQVELSKIKTQYKDDPQLMQKKILEHFNKLESRNVENLDKSLLECINKVNILNTFGKCSLYVALAYATTLFL